MGMNQPLGPDNIREFAQRLVDTAEASSLGVPEILLAMGVAARTLAQTYLPQRVDLCEQLVLKGFQQTVHVAKVDPHRPN